MKVLIRLPNWLGDVVMSTAFINAVGQLYPDALIDIVVKKELGDIASLIPGLNKVHLFSRQTHKGLSGVYSFGKSLRPERYDLYFNLPNSLSSFVMAWASGAKKRIGFNKEGGLFLLTNSFKKPAGMHRVDEYISLLERFTGKTIGYKQVRLQHKQPVIDGNTVVVNFNSEAASRRMPADKAGKMLKALLDAFKDIKFVLVGSARDAAFVNEIVNGLSDTGRLQNMAGKTGLDGLAEIMAGSKAVLTTDSGPAHLANGVGVPTIVLFGAGNEQNTAPYNEEHLTVIRYGELVCEPCVRNTCKLYGIPKCMEMLDEIKVINALSLHLNYA